MASFFPTSKGGLLAPLLLLLALFAANIRITGAKIGVCYGMLGNNLPSPRDVVNLYRANNIRRMRLYDPNQAALEALKGSGIELMLGVPNSDIQSLASNPDNARQWVQGNVLNFYPNVTIKYVAVGNQVDPVGDSSGVARFVLSAIQNVYQALKAQNLHYRIKVSTAISMALLGNSYPPSQGSFRDDVRSYLDPIIKYLVYAHAPLFVNIYPYFGHKDNPRDISLSYALFTAPNVVVQDGSKAYQNLFDAMLDSVYAALNKTGTRYVRVVVSESGWPSGGGFAATTDNARTYLDSLIRHVKKGTPVRRGPIETYLFAMFDENQKSLLGRRTISGCSIPTRRISTRLGLKDKRTDRL